jgi:predicted RNA-binding protein YlxR (DUF448 family)
MTSSVRRIERTCCVCRARAEKRDLIRLVCNEGRLEFDEECVWKGRGAYVHADTSCIARAAQPGRWERALKVTPGTLCGQQVSQLFAKLMSRVTASASPDERRGDWAHSHQGGKGANRRVRL